MSQFEYITVFLSIVMALAVAGILGGLGRLIRERERVKVYWASKAGSLSSSRYSAPADCEES